MDDAESEVADLERGRQAGLDARPGDDDPADGVVLTHASSSWHHQTCVACGHSFRRGDRVRIADAGRMVVHLAPELECGREPQPSEDAVGSGTEHADLIRGLMEAWPEGNDARVTQLAPDDWRIDRRGRAEPRPSCLYCGHTLRPGEFVVRCPCGRRPECGAAVHRDPAAGLPCWERWRPRAGLSVCPVTLERVEGR